MHVDYRPGTWTALVADRSVVIVPAATQPDHISRIWEGLRSEPDLTDLVDLIARGVGGSLAALPEFAILVVDGTDTRVAVRGAVAATARSASGEESLDGRNVSTWSERLLSGAEQVELRMESSADAAFPIGSGVVRAAEVHIDLVATAEPGVRVTTAAPSSDDAESVPAAQTPVVDPRPTGDAQLPITQALDVSELPSLHRFTPAAVGAATAAQSAGGPVPVPSVDETDVPLPRVDAVAVPSPAPENPEESSEPIVEERDPIDTLFPEDVSSSADIDEFDQLWGDTIHRPAAEAVAAAPVGVDGDHDGETISLAEARSHRRRVPEAQPEAVTEVLAVAPTTLARVVLSTGQTAVLDRAVIIGRRPRSTRASGDTMPHLIAVESPQQDISRSHLEVRPEGDAVLVIDLHTTNGSTLLRPGADPVRLHPGEHTLVMNGDVVDLGDGVTVTFEDLP